MQSGQIGYVKDAAECVRQVEAGEFQTALFLNPTPPDAVKEVALAGRRCLKINLLLPKALSGLVMRRYIDTDVDPRDKKTKSVCGNPKGG